MKKTKVISLVALSVLSSLFVTVVFALEDAGRVMFVAGKAMIVDANGQERVARKGAFLKQGDRLVTSDKGMIQVKMRDNGLMAVRPNTDLKMNNMVPQRNKADAPSQTLLLSRGGVRVLTGNERNKMGYLIKTAATSIGLREGDTEALVIPRLTAAADRIPDSTPAGTYNRVNAGIGLIQGVTGNGIPLMANQISFTPSVNIAPVLVASLPPSYVNTTIPLQISNVVSPTLNTTALSPATVPGGLVLAPSVVAPITVTTIAPVSVVGTVTVSPAIQPATTVTGTVTPILTGLTPLPLALAPIAVIMPPPPPPVMLPPPPLIFTPIVVIPPPIYQPPPVIISRCKLQGLC